MHLIVVRRDTTAFQHVQIDGYTVERRGPEHRHLPLFLEQT